MDVDLIVTSFPKLLSASLVTLKLLSLKEKQLSVLKTID